MAITTGPKLDSILLAIANRIDTAIVLGQLPHVHDLTMFGLLTNTRESGNPTTHSTPTDIMLQATSEQIDVILANLESEINESINVSIQPFEQYLLLYGYFLNIKANGNPLSGSGGAASWTGP